MLKKACNTVSIIFSCVITLLAVLLVGVRLVGLKPYAVLSGSMSPAYPVGALIYVKPVQPQKIQAGDAITFYLNDGATVATHRVVRVDAPSECFYTKGDANETPDASPVDFAWLIGTPVLAIPALGYISIFMATPLGLCVAGILVLAAVLPPVLAGLGRKDTGETSAQTAKARLRSMKNAEN